LFSATWPKPKHQDFLQKHVVGEPLEPDLPQTLLQLDCVTAASIQETTTTTTRNLSSPSSSFVNPNVQEYFFALTSMDSYLDNLVSILQHELILDPYAKIVVFFPAAKLVQFLARVVSLDDNNIGGGGAVQISAIHSRISQSQRQRVSQKPFEVHPQQPHPFCFRLMYPPGVWIIRMSPRSFNMDCRRAENCICIAWDEPREQGSMAKAYRIQVSLPFEPDSPPWLPKRNKKENPFMKTYPLPAADLSGSSSSIPSLSSRLLLEQAQSVYKSFVANYDFSTLSNKIYLR
jgi:hypothetical protein